MVGLHGDFKREIEVCTAGKTAATYFIINGIEQVWGTCVGRCGGVSRPTRPQRGSTEKEPEDPEITKNKERIRKEKPVLFGRYPV